MPHVELPQAEFKAVMLGDTNAGKTSLVLRFAEGYYRDSGRSSATVGAFFITKRIQTSTGITCKVQIWDTAGQAQFRPMAPMYYRNAAAAIVCYDVTSRQSYKVMREWLDELHKNVPAGRIVIAIAATKTDLTNNHHHHHHHQSPSNTPNNKFNNSPNSTTTNNNNNNLTSPHKNNNSNNNYHNDTTPNNSNTQTIDPESEAKELAEALGAIYVETSAKTNTNVNDLFQRVAERVLLFRDNARRDGGGVMMDEKNGIPVTPGASVRNGKVIKPRSLGSGSRGLSGSRGGGGMGSGLGTGGRSEDGGSGGGVGGLGSGRMRNGKAHFTFDNHMIESRQPMAEGSSAGDGGHMRNVKSTDGIDDLDDDGAVPSKSSKSMGMCEPMVCGIMQTSDSKGSDEGSSCVVS